jgi:hypothetical protein
MDEKTAELRDIFQDVADTETVTESQSDDRGSLADEDALREQLREVIDHLAANEGLAVGLDRETLVDVVIGYYDGEDDETIARNLDVDANAATVRQGRLACHLIRDDDLEASFDVDRLRTLRQDGLAPSACADRLEADPDAVERVAEALDARAAMIRTGRRYPDAFESALAEAGLAEQFTADAKRDGLEGATADAEVETDF